MRRHGLRLVVGAVHLAFVGLWGHVVLLLGEQVRAEPAALPAFARPAAVASAATASSTRPDGSAAPFAAGSARRALPGAQLGMRAI